MYPNKKNGNTLEKEKTKLYKLQLKNINTNNCLSVEVDPPLTARKNLTDLQESISDFSLNNQKLYDKLQKMRNEITALQNTINNLTRMQ